MRRFIPALLVSVACLVVQAEQTGRISGKVTDLKGQPIAGAKITLKRTDRNWIKVLVTDSKGNYIQVGLDPKEFDFTVTADGFVDFKEANPIKIPLADVLVKNVSMRRPDEARAEAILAGGGNPVQVDDPARLKDAEGREAFNQAIPLYNESKFAEALPFVEKAFKTLTEALATLKEEEDRKLLAPELPKIERVFGICLAQAGEKKADAEPYLLKALERNPKDERVIAALVDVSKAKGDAAGEQKYQGLLEAMHGPNPDSIYNKGVEAFNNGQVKEAKAHLLKALEVDPKYAKAHYLLGMVEYTNMNLKGTKQHFLQYLELAPTGDKASEIKEMLKDPSLKNIK